VVIQVDSREKARAITKIISTFDSQHIDHFISKLPVGDYMSLDNPRVVIDRKQNLLEICGNVCQELPRFRAELQRAKQYGIKVIILCEHGRDIKTMADVIQWENPRLKTSPMAMSGERLYKVMSALKSTYGVEWRFCDKSHTGQRIINILSGLEAMEDSG
jgi:hypothetical protein